MSQPCVYGGCALTGAIANSVVEPAPCVRGMHFLTRLNAQPSSEIHSLVPPLLHRVGLTFCQTVTLKPAKRQIILVLTLSRPFIPSPVSHGRGFLVTEAFYASAYKRSASRRMLMAALRSRSISAWQCSHLYTRSFRVSLVSGRSPQLLQVCEDG